MIYFIHDTTSRAIKIGCAWNPARRLSTLQISSPNKLVLLGAIAGMKAVEEQVHALVCQHGAGNPAEPGARPLWLQGEWFDDRVLPFVNELMKSPRTYLREKEAKARSASKVPALHQGTLDLSCDTGETFRETFTLHAASPEQAMAALGNIASARLPFLAHTARVMCLSVPGCPAKTTDLRGAFVTQSCDHRTGLSVVFSSEPSGLAMRDGVKQYSHRWLHGVPSELYGDARYSWHHRRVFARPTEPFVGLLERFALALARNQCVISSQIPLAVRALVSRGVGALPKGELRSKVNRRAAGGRKGSRTAGEVRSKGGIVYFIRDTVRGAIKIGFCLKRPEKRLAALQTGNANPLRLIGHVPGSEFHEGFLHRQFSRFRLHGEWFSDAIGADVAEIWKCSSVEEWLKARNPGQRRDDVAVTPAPGAATDGRGG
ncbi:MAG: GIY-YIG nuclease family protein [Gemmataceae bacterium]